MKHFWFFDLDGTLADTEGDIRRAWKAALTDLQLECPQFDAVYVTGPSIEEITKRLFPETWTDAMVQAIRGNFARHYDTDGFPLTKEYPGVLDKVRALKAAGAHVAIVTNKRLAGAKAMAARFGWNSVFEGIYTADMHRDNPAIGVLRKPELLKRVMSELGASAADSVMVGDTINDFEAAAKNGVESVAVIWGYGKSAEWAEATRVAHTPEEIG